MRLYTGMNTHSTERANRMKARRAGQDSIDESNWPGPGELHQISDQNMDRIAFIKP
jgi:hypothetical protein